jgi:hypothetical protein
MKHKLGRPGPHVKSTFTGDRQNHTGTNQWRIRLAAESRAGRRAAHEAGLDMSLVEAALKRRKAGASAGHKLLIGSRAGRSHAENDQALLTRLKDSGLDLL